MTWLGGGGYSLARLVLHGVNYTKRDGSKVFGSYIPILFEDLADPIITGRDDVGFPKLFADIAIQEDNGGNATISLKWRSTEFCRLQIEGLAEEQESRMNGNVEGGRPTNGAPPSSPPPDHGNLVYRYVPAVGRSGVADAEYAVLVPHITNDGTAGPTTRRVTQSASLEFSACDWQSLPTLHHVAEKLAGMPIYSIEGAERATRESVDDLSGAMRIE